MTDYAHPVQSFGDKPPASVTKRDRARFLTQELKASVRGLLHHDDEQESFPEDEIFEDTAFDPQKALRPEEKSGRRSIGDRINIGARAVANTIKNPKAVGRNNYTRHAVAKIANHPHDQSTEFDDELLNAHDALTSAQEKYEVSNRDNADTPLKSVHAVEVVDAQSRVRRIEEQRDNLKSGWVLGRHVVRVKAVRPMTSKPEREQFLSESASPGQPPQLQIGPYLGHLALWYTKSFTTHRIDDYDEPPFDLGELALTVERLAAVSTPWQTFAHKVRHVYCWDNPTRTAQIMVAYWILWYFQRLITFGVGFIIYITLRNKIYPTTVQAVRERVERSRNQSAKVQAWGELVQKHGGSDWVEPLLDGIGPHLQLQLSDLTNFLERLQNFYRWEQPRSTWISLYFFLTVLVFLLLASTQLCVDVVWLVLGSCFFYGTPISTHYPKYRHLVSPASWFFWTVPDAAELSIDQLQQKVAARDDIRVQALRDEANDGILHQTQGMGTAPEVTSPEIPYNSYSTPSDTVPRDVSDLLRQVRSNDSLRFKTSLLPSHLGGYVILSRTHITFEAKERNIFSYPYTAIVEIFKVSLNKNPKQTTTSDGKSKLSRMTHMSKSIEKNENIQLLPDGLGFIFAENYPVDVDFDARSQTYVNTTDTEPARDPRTIQQPDQRDLPNGEDLEAAAISDADYEREEKKGVTLVLNKSDRDKIFTVVLAWSNMKWQPLYSMNRQNKLGVRKKGTGKMETADGGSGGNGNLDDAIKRALL